MQNSDIQYFNAAGNTTVAATNGGRMDGASQITSGSPGVVFQTIRSAERAANTQECEKIFCANRNADNEIGYYPKIYLDGDPSLGDDYAWFVAGSQRNFEDDLTGSEQKYVAGELKDAITDTAESCVVVVKNAAQAAAFYVGGTVRFASGRFTTTPTLVDVEVLTVSVSSLEVTLTFAAIGTAFSAGALVSMVYEPASNVTPSIDNTSYTGGADIDSSNIDTDNQGTIEQTWTLTVLAGATTFSLVGDEVGNVGTGTIGVDFAPTNGDVSLPYLTILSNAFDGLTVAQGDTFTFQSHPAASPIFLFKVNPADAELVSSNNFTAVMEYEN